MLVLGIESSCDETGVALYDTKLGLLTEALHTQIDMHRDYGGVVPELASRDHIRRIIPLIDKVMAKANKKKDELDAIAVTEGPGLAGALLVGTSVAFAIGEALGIPVIGIHHLEGHLLSPLLSENPPSFPFVALLISGGNTQLVEVRGLGQYKLLGETLDDAVGEAFDKTAQILGKPYPGGPFVSKMAELGEPKKLSLPRPLLHSHDLDFSFSGLKTAVLNAVKQQPQPLSENFKNDLCREFVDAVTEVLTTKCLKALKQTKLRTLVVGGGVSANKQIRASLIGACKRIHARVYFPPSNLCTDNGAMIAVAAAAHLREIDKGKTDIQGFQIKPRWTLSTP